MPVRPLPVEFCCPRCGHAELGSHTRPVSPLASLLRLFGGKGDSMAGEASSALAGNDNERILALPRL